MKTCPNPKCKTTGIPDEAKFCPNCGSLLQKEEPFKKMTISECRLVPSIIKKGEQCRLVWKGENVKYIEIDNQHYDATNDILLTPSQSHTYRVNFGREGTSISTEVRVTVEIPFLFGECGKELGLGWVADARQLVRVGGIGMQGDYYFNGDKSDDRWIEYYFSDGNPRMKITISGGKLHNIEYFSGIDVLVKRDIGDKYPSLEQPHIIVTFYNCYTESGLLIKRKHFTDELYRYKSLFRLGFRDRGDGVNVAPELSEAEWMNRYGKEFYAYCDQYLPLLIKIFGFDPIYEKPFWRW